MANDKMYLVVIAIIAVAAILGVSIGAGNNAIAGDLAAVSSSTAQVSTSLNQINIKLNSALSLLNTINNNTNVSSKSVPIAPPILYCSYTITAGNGAGPYYSCTDSDGIDPCTFGYVTLRGTANSTTSILNDTCTSQYLSEYSCIGNATSMYWMTSTQINCTNGCSNGRCL